MYRLSLIGQAPPGNHVTISGVTRAGFRPATV